ncbi:hypothetical protein J437_LFUL003779, partial [Ladona fulva]
MNNWGTIGSMTEERYVPSRCWNVIRLLRHVKKEQIGRSAFQIPRVPSRIEPLSARLLSVTCTQVPARDSSMTRIQPYTLRLSLQQSMNKSLAMRKIISRHCVKVAIVVRTRPLLHDGGARSKGATRDLTV